MAQSIIANTVVAAGGRALNIAFGIAALSLVSRFLGVAQFGAYATLFALGAIIQIFADAGLYLTLTRAIAEEPGQENQLIGHIASLRLTLLLSAFSIGAVVVLALPSLRPLLLVYSLLAIGFIAQSLSQLLMGIYQKYAVIWRATVGDLLGRLVQIVGLLWLTATGASLAAIAAMFTAGAAVALFLHQQLLPRPVRLTLAFSWTAWRKISIGAAPLAALLILNVIHFRIDIILLAELRSAAEAGLYGVAYRLIESILFLPAMFAGLLLPRLTAAWHRHQPDRFRQYVSEGLRVMSWVALFIAVSFYWLAGDLIRLISGPDFAAAAAPLRLLALALLPLFIGNIGGIVLVASRQQKTLLAVALFATLINIWLNLMFIPRWGIAAAAWTTVGTEAAASIAVLAAAYRSARPLLSLLPAARLALTAASAAVVYAILPPAAPLYASLPAAGAAYLLATWLLRVISRQNITALLAST